MRGPFAFGSDSKLPDKPAFDRVFAEPDFRLRRHPFMLLARSQDFGRSRLGLVVGKKHARRAVARNRIRRAAREQFRLILGRHDTLVDVVGRQPLARDERESMARRSEGLDVILMARPGAAEFDKAELAEVIEWLFDRLLREATKVGPPPLSSTERLPQPQAPASPSEGTAGKGKAP